MVEIQTQLKTQADEMRAQIEGLEADLRHASSQTQRQHTSQSKAMRDELTQQIESAVKSQSNSLTQRIDKVALDQQEALKVITAQLQSLHELVAQANRKS
jgi:hypothetical protein